MRRNNARTNRSIACDIRTRNRLFSIIRPRKAPGGAKILDHFRHRRIYFIRIAHLENRRRKSARVRTRTAETPDSLNAGDDDLSFRLSDFIQPTTLRDAIAFEAADATVSVTSKWNIRFSSYASRTITPRKIERSSFAPVRTTLFYGYNNNLSLFCLSNLWSRPASPCSSVKYLLSFVCILCILTRRVHDNLQVQATILFWPVLALFYSLTLFFAEMNIPVLAASFIF